MDDLDLLNDIEDLSELDELAGYLIAEGDREGFSDLLDLVGVGGLPDALRPVTASPEASPEGIQRRCAEHGCGEAAMARKGNRGRHPRFCEFHTADRKRRQDNGGSKARPQYKPCCIQWQAAGNGGLCPQCRDNRDEWREPVYPASAGEAKFLVKVLGTADGFHIDPPAPPKGWHSNRGPDEGDTIWRNGYRVRNADPYEDSWFTDHRGWITDSESNNYQDR